jgi:HrpA-like RNA helicase
MQDYEVSEVHRQPMTEVALRLKAMLSSVRSTGDAAAVAAPNEDSDDEAEDTGAATPRGAEESIPAASDKPMDDVAKGHAPSSSTEELGGDASVPASSPSVEPRVPKTKTAVPAAAASIPDLPGVTAVLRALIEPPSLQSIHDALRTLHECGMLTSPRDESQLTEIGSLAAELPVDFMLGRFIGYAVLLGVAREAVVIAAALGNPKSPFRTPNQLLQTDPDEFNRCVAFFVPHGTTRH